MTNSKSLVELGIEDIQGLGPTTARQMKESGITSVMELATTMPELLTTDLGGSKETAAIFIMAA
jgi:DNA repair protein RadA